MSSGLNVQKVSNDYIVITDSGTNSTGLKIANYLWEVVNEETRKVTVYNETTLAIYRIKGNWNVGTSDKVGGTVYGGEQYISASIDGSSKPEWYDTMMIRPTGSFFATPGGVYTYRDGYVSGIDGEGWKVVQSKTFDYNTNGDAISKNWSAEARIYSMISGYVTIKNSGSFTTSSIKRAYTNPSMDSATITNKVLGPYHIHTSMSGASYGTEYTSTSLKCNVSYTLDGVNYSYDAKTWNDGSTSGECNIDGLILSQNPWEKVPDGGNITISWIATSTNPQGTVSAVKSASTLMPYAYDAYVISPGTTRKFYLFNENLLVTSYDSSTILSFIQEAYPDVSGDFDIVIYFNKDSNSFEAWLYYNKKSECLKEQCAGITMHTWLSRNLGISIMSFVSNQTLYNRDVQARITYTSTNIEKCDMYVSNKAGERPSKQIRRIGIIDGQEVPFKEWAYLYIGETDDEEDWVELNLSEADWKSLFTTNSYVMIGGRKIDKDLIRGITIGENPTTIKSHFLEGCTNLNTYFEIPDNIEVIGSNFLAGCSSFNCEIGLNKVKTVGSGFMKDCTSFNQNLDASSLESIGSGFMHNCDSFDSIITVGDTVPPASDTVLSTENENAKLYKIGVTLDGDEADIEAWLEAFPGRSESPYRHVYSINDYEALKSREYDALNLYSDDYDDYELTSKQYDERGKTILDR